MNSLKLLSIMTAIFLWSCPAKAADDTNSPLTEQGIAHDTFATRSGSEVKIHFIKHASLILEVDGKFIYIDPAAIYGHDFSKMPKADAVMVTHEHHDHFDPAAIGAVSRHDTRFICNGRVAELAGKGEAMAPGDTLDLLNINIVATPAYNITDGHLQYHPKARKDVGFVYDIDGLRIYVAGDTEDISEMSGLGDIDIAFIPVNQPFTMTPQQAVNAIKMISPRIAYPYHYGDTDLAPIVEAFKTDASTEVRVRELQ